MTRRLNQQIGKYRIDFPLSAGTFGKVYHATHEGKSYAIKEMLQPTRWQIRLRMDNQIKALSQLEHPNIVKLYQVIQSNGYVYLIMECCEKDLKEVLDKQIFNENKAMSVFTQIVKGFKELVRLNIVHRDVKPANILLSNGVYKLADFGLVKYIQEEQQMLRTKVGTPYYMSPQILNNETYTSKCDIWSLGIILYQMIFSCLPWYAKTEQSLIDIIKKKPLHFPKKTSPKINKLLLGMIQINQADRMSWNQLFEELDIKGVDQHLRNQITFKKSTISKLMSMQLNRISLASFRNKFEYLRGQQKKSVIGLVLKLFKDQYRSLCLQAIQLQ